MAEAHGNRTPIVPVYDAGNLGDHSPFHAMKLVAGRPLDEAIAAAKTLAQRLALLPSVLAVADAMAYAHNQRIDAVVGSATAPDTVAHHAQSRIGHS